MTIAFESSNQGLQEELLVTITAMEERLRVAMLASDVQALDSLISSKLMFTNHFGQVLDKQTDLSLHQSRTLRFQELQASEMHIQAYGDTALVSVRMHVQGSFAGAMFTENFRYTRIWHLSSTQGWQVVAGHMSVVQDAGLTG
jgi:ketosteroid isomerase-like protein